MSESHSHSYYKYTVSAEQHISKALHCSVNRRVSGSSAHRWRGRAAAGVQRSACGRSPGGGLMGSPTKGHLWRPDALLSSLIIGIPLLSLKSIDKAAPSEQVEGLEGAGGRIILSWFIGDMLIPFQHAFKVRLRSAIRAKIFINVLFISWCINTVWFTQWMIKCGPGSSPGWG